MPTRKRRAAEMEAASDPPSAPSANASGGDNGLLTKLRNMWEFANLMQYIYTFGKVVKIDDDLDIEALEMECLRPDASPKLAEIGLALLKFVSSHRGLTPEIFEEYTRRQYLAKAPSRNPFGDEETPVKFGELDIFQRIRVLQQLSVWTFGNPERIRERMEEQKEMEQTQWRVEEVGYDSDERLYFVLDDNRLYRRTDPEIPAPKTAKPKPKANTRKARAAARKRRKLSQTGAAQDGDEDEEKDENAANGEGDQDTFGGMKWECIAVSLTEYQDFLKSIHRTKDPDEQILRDRLTEDVLPVIEKLEEAQQKKIARREKELLNLQKLASAKRSSRIAGRQEKEKQEQEAAEEERKRQAELIAARKDEERQKKIEKERMDRMKTREQRTKEREQRRLQHEEELARIAEEKKRLENGEGRISERQLKAELKKRKESLEALQQPEEWVFDCSGCGMHGENLDDGSHSVACEKCNVWQHSKCLKISQAEAEKDDFHFVCADCKRRAEEAKRPKIPPLKFRVGASASPSAASPSKANGERRPSHGVYDTPSGQKLQHVLVSPQTSRSPFLDANSSINQSAGAVSPQKPQFSPMKANGHSPSKPPSHHGTPAMSNGHANGLAASPMGYPRFNHNAMNQTPRHPHDRTASPFLSQQRPSSSHSAQNQVFPSPIQNRPSMSPTQGNRDVGPLAGFPSSTIPTNSLPNTPHSSFGASSSQYTTGPNQSFPSAPPPGPVSFTSTHSQSQSSFSNTPPHPPHSQHPYPNQQPPPQQHYHHQHETPISGLSPTKHSPPPPRPMSSSFGSGMAMSPPHTTTTATGTTTSGSGVGGIMGPSAPTSVMPPIQQLQPSPKLMGRSSPDEPIPAPMKSLVVPPPSQSPGLGSGGVGVGVGVNGHGNGHGNGVMQQGTSQGAGNNTKDNEEL
ncbi:hypothetical protein FQN54_002053 [Arachnomyces sp. PD_36]|nr:hypothetical protein FQN54_002053 [Arachnomyces sp. PD_36]